MEFENNLWNKFLLSCIFRGLSNTEVEQKKKSIIAYRDDGDLIFLFKKNKDYSVEGWDTEKRDFFTSEDIDRAYLMLIKTPTTKILNSKIWEQFKREVALKELMKE